jgi:nicotinamidase-related amidase
MPDNNTRHTSRVALVLIDVINHFEFPGGDKILRQALPMAARLARLKQRCRGAGIPAIYVNDNFGQWRSDAKSVIARCLESSCAGKPFVGQLRPDDGDYLVLKPMHAGFQPVRPLELFGGAQPARARPADRAHQRDDALFAYPIGPVESGRVTSRKPQNIVSPVMKGL